MKLQYSFNGEKNLFFLIEKEPNGGVYMHHGCLTEEEINKKIPSLLRQYPDGVFYVIGPYSSHQINIKESIITYEWE